MGSSIDAATAERIGMVNRVVPLADLDTITLEWAKRIAKVPSGKPGGSASQPEMSRQSRPLAMEDTGARGAARAASRPKSLSQPAPETRTPTARAAKQVQYNIFLQNT